MKNETKVNKLKLLSASNADSYFHDINTDDYSDEVIAEALSVMQNYDPAKLTYLQRTLALKGVKQLLTSDLLFDNSFNDDGTVDHKGVASSIVINNMALRNLRSAGFAMVDSQKSRKLLDRPTPTPTAKPKKEYKL